MEEFFIRTQGLAVGYHGIPLVQEINFTLAKGEILTLIGPNGAGKSTILRSLIRQLRPVAGTVYLDGQSMEQMQEGQIARRMSVLMTERMHPELMTCREVVETGRYPYTGRLGILQDGDRQKVQEALELVHARELGDQDFSQISDGQRQRILLARAICQEPEVIVMDEPTSFLDIRYKLELLAILKGLVREKQVAVILSLHELDLAQKISDHLACVHQGRIERYGTPEEVFSDGYIQTLYSLERGSYNELFGSLEMEPVLGEPRVFVIGGGGSGIPCYRKLQRRGVPFAAGILAQNDIDYPVAAALASQVVGAAPYQPFEEEEFHQARQLLLRCGKAICCTKEFGPLNEKNRLLARYAQETGMLVEEEP